LADDCDTAVQLVAPPALNAMADARGLPSESDTRCGNEAPTTVPSPSCPCAFAPQQTTLPSALVRAHVCCAPAASARAPRKPVPPTSSTRVGNWKGDADPLPNSPESLRPQQ